MGTIWLKRRQKTAWKRDFLGKKTETETWYRRTNGWPNGGADDDANVTRISIWRDDETRRRIIFKFI
jgi:hypothetical protein